MPVDTNSPVAEPVDETQQPTRHSEKRDKGSQRSNTRRKAAPEVSPDHASPEDGGAPQNKRRGLSGSIKRHPVTAGTVLLVVLLVAAGAVLWWLNARNYEWTDDAFIDARTVTVGAEF